VIRTIPNGARPVCQLSDSRPGFWALGKESRLLLKFLTSTSRSRIHGTLALEKGQRGFWTIGCTRITRNDIFPTARHAPRDGLGDKPFYGATVGAA